MTDDEVRKALTDASKALDDAASWFEDGNMGQASAAVSEARGILYDLDEELVHRPEASQHKSETPEGK